MKNRFLPAVGLVSALGALSANAAPADAPAPLAATITVDAKNTLGPVNPLVFGHNIEAADQYNIFGSFHNYATAQNGGGIWNPAKNAPVAQLVADSKSVGMRLLRYPGGCFVHNFHWKETIGPVADRPNFTFGVDEYLAYCKAVGAAPVITISDYADTSQDAADLVEYLNSPADAAHPWAQKRAANGHAAPYAVRYFELGNESDHGNHDLQPPRKFSPDDYVAYYVARADKMKAADPTIQLGALLGTGTGPFGGWNGPVLTALKNKADFIIVHTYVVGIASDADAQAAKPDFLMRACLASDNLLTHEIADYHAQIKKYVGRDLPLAVTEYNANFVQDKPIPYRFSYGGALFAADYIRVLLQPKSNVLLANYWQFANSYWGMVRNGANGTGEHNAPAFPLFRLWGQHFGDTLVQTSVESPRLSFEGLWRRGGEVSVPPMHGEVALPAAPVGDNLLQAVAGTTDKPLSAPLYAETKNEYPGIAPNVPVQGSTDYVISFEARRSESAPLPASTDWGLSLVDTRGWEATQSGIAMTGVEKSAEWKPYTATFRTLPDATGLGVSWRLLGWHDAPGTPQIRNLSLTAIRPASLPGYPALTATVSRAKDGKKLYLMVFNKSADAPVAAQINVKNFAPKSARLWQVNGPALETTNQDDGEKVREVKSGEVLALPKSGPLSYVFPAHSMTAIELE